jgi:hypothetical protein
MSPLKPFMMSRLLRCCVRPLCSPDRSRTGSITGRAHHSEMTPGVDGHDIPPLPAPDEDPQWQELLAEVRSMERMRDVQQAAQQCQVAVAQLSELATLDGALGEAANRQLHRLALDVHQECRRVDTPVVDVDPAARLTLDRWLWSPAGSGEPPDGDLESLRRTHHRTLAVRTAGAGLAAVHP